MASTRALARADQCERSVQGDRGDGAETAMDLNRTDQRSPKLRNLAFQSDSRVTYEKKVNLCHIQEETDLSAVVYRRCLQRSFLLQ